MRALRYYVQNTKSVRKDRQLFVSVGAKSLGKKVSVQTISRWIRLTICKAYAQMGRELPISEVRAHSTRAMATSLADFIGASAEDLCTAATWASPVVFVKHYRLDLAASRGIAFQVLEAAVATM